MTYTLIDSVTLASSAASVTFSSIDQSYGDLVLVVEATRTTSGASIEITFNGSSANYNYVLMTGYPSTTGSFAQSNQGSIGQTVFWSPYEANIPTLTTLEIMEYSATDKHKSALMTINSPNRGVLASANRWADTSAVTSITFSTNSIAAGSTFHLYAIAKAL